MDCITRTPTKRFRWCHQSNKIEGKITDEKKKMKFGKSKARNQIVQSFICYYRFGHDIPHYILKERNSIACQPHTDCQPQLASAPGGLDVMPNWMPWRGVLGSPLGEDCPPCWNKQNTRVTTTDPMVQALLLLREVSGGGWGFILIRLSPQTRWHQQSAYSMGKNNLYRKF